MSTSLKCSSLTLCKVQNVHVSLQSLYFNNDDDDDDDEDNDDNDNNNDNDDYICLRSFSAPFG